MPLRFVIFGQTPALLSAPDPAGTLAEAPIAERTCELPDELREIRLGRQPGLEIELPFPSVSFVHARLFCGELPNDWWVEDLGSLNGTTVDGRRLTPGIPQALRPNQRIRIASVDLLFEGRAAKSAEPSSTASIARLLIGDVFAKRPADSPTLLVVSGPGAGSRLVLAESGRPYVIGRSDDCDLVLPTDSVSREHAVFVRNPEGVLVRDRGSKNGVRVGGRAISPEGRHLGDGERVQIGTVWLELSSPEDRYLRQVQAAAEVPRSSSASATKSGTVKSSARGGHTRPNRTLTTRARDRTPGSSSAGLDRRAAAPRHGTARRVLTAIVAATMLAALAGLAALALSG